MNSSTIVEYELNDGTWVYYNIITQMLVESSLKPDEFYSSISDEIKEELLFATAEEELKEFNHTYFREATDQLKKTKRLCETFNPEKRYVLLLWSACNFSCPYCYQQQEEYIESHNNWKDSLDIERIIDLIDRNSQNGKYPPESFVIMGGEPFLIGKRYESNLNMLLNHISKRFSYVKVVFSTNGYNLDHYIPLLQQYENIKWEFRITLGYNKAQHKRTRILKSNPSTNSWEKILANIKTISNSLDCPTVIIRFNIENEMVNTNSLLQTIKSLKNQFPFLRFHIASIVKISVLQKNSDAYLKLAVQIYQDKNLSEYVKILDNLHIESLIQYVSGKNNVKSTIPYLCNAFSFNRTVEFYPPFNTQPCERITLYNVVKEEIRLDKKKWLKWEKEITQKCLSCPFFVYCISALCNILGDITHNSCFEQNKSTITQLLTIYDNYYLKDRKLQEIKI